jgi:hypothetical protein
MEGLSCSWSTYFLALLEVSNLCKLTSDQDDGVLTWMVGCHLDYSSDIIQARGVHTHHPKILEFRVVIRGTIR